MMTASNPYFKTEIFQQIAQVIKMNVCIGISTQNFKQKLFMFTHFFLF